MIFQLKAASLKPGLKKQLNCIFMIATQNDENQVVLDMNTRNRLPESIQNMLATTAGAEHFTAANGQVLNLIDAERFTQFIIIGTGKKSEKTAKIAAQAMIQYCQQYEILKAALLVDEQMADELAINQFILTAADLAYTFEAPNGMHTGEHAQKNAKKAEQNAKRTIVLMTHRAPTSAQKQQFANAVAIAQGCALSKQLGNLPGNYATPNYLGETAKKLAKQYGFKVQVLERKQMTALKMNAFLSVAKGSTEAPRFIILEYKGAGTKAAPTVLVGKGVTFDSGGISLKPGAAMDEMKYDMCGAASVFGTFKVLGELKPNINVIGLIPACENMPAGNANKPGDVVTSMAGLTIEVLNTDAEGRLLLCDALTYAERYQPSAVVDIATLTGACIVALGHHHSGLFTNNDELAQEVQAAGQTQQDTAWRMPLDPEYAEQLKSNFADLANIGGMPAGSVTAACFLSKFAEKYPWVHLDIAGTAWKSGANKSATGRPVPLLSQFLLNRSGKAKLSVNEK